MGNELLKESTENTYKLLICPECYKQTPELIIHNPSNNKSNLFLRCQCFKGEKSTSIQEYLKKIEKIKVSLEEKCVKHSDTNAQRFCAQCCTWLCQNCSYECKKGKCKDHQLLHFQFNIMCTEHKAPFTHYCQYCTQNLCQECKKTLIHQKHQIIQIPSIDPIQIEKDNKLIDKVIKKNHKNLQGFIYKFYNDNQQMDLKTKTEKEKELNDQFENYKNINESYKQFLEYLLSSKRFLVANMNYSINNLFGSIKVNLDEIMINTIDFPSAFVEIKKYLETNYIISLKPQLIEHEEIIKINKKTYECINVLDHSSIVIGMIELNNNTILSASTSLSNTEFKLWNSQSLKVIKGIPHPDPIRCMVRLPNDQIALGVGNIITITSSIIDRSFVQLNEHASFVTCLIYLEHNNLIVSASDDYSIKIWKIGTEKIFCRNTLKDHSARVNCLVEYKTDHIASGSDDNTIRLWDLNNESCVSILNGHTTPVKCLVSLPDLRLGSGGENNVIMIWELKTYTCISKLEEHTDCIMSFELLDDNRFASCSKDQTIKIWDSYTLECKVTLEAKKEISKCLLQLKNGLLLSGTVSNNINVWDI